MDSKQAALGQPVRDFELPDINAQPVRLSRYLGSTIVITFWSAECPVSAEYDTYFNTLHDRYAGEPVVILGIDSNVNYSQDEIAQAVRDRGVRYPVLRDAASASADYFGALTTPHVYIVDAEGRLAYKGGVDDRTFRQREATVNYVDQALAALLDGETPPVQESNPYGCTIVRG